MLQFSSLKPLGHIESRFIVPNPHIDLAHLIGESTCQSRLFVLEVLTIGTVHTKVSTHKHFQLHSSNHYIAQSKH